MIAPLPAVDPIPGTMSVTTAARTHWQAVIVGAGPAGSAAAWRLAARGLRVLLVDRGTLPRSKVCGCCLSSSACRELNALGPAAMPEAAVPLNDVTLLHGSRRVRIPMPTGRTVSRDVLDAHLVREAIAAGCHWLPATPVHTVRDDGGDGDAPVEVVAEDRSTGGRTCVLRAERVVLATGLVDPVRIGAAATVAEQPARWVARGSRIGVGAVLDASASELPAGELLMAVGRAGYCGVVRLDDGRIDVAAAVDRAMLAGREPARAVMRLLEEVGGAAARGLPAAGAIASAAWRATPALTRRAKLVAGGSRRVLRVGDAAGYVEPFTGEGIGWALAGARILAESVLGRGGLLPPHEAARRYAARHRRMFIPLHARCRAVAATLRRPILVSGAVAAAEAAPWAARWIAPAVIGGVGHGGVP